MLTSASAQTVTGKVAGLSDGDITTVLDENNTQRKIRPDGPRVERGSFPQCSWEAMEEKPDKAEKKARRIETPCI
jgi:hypothetical protein